MTNVYVVVYVLCAFMLFRAFVSEGHNQSLHEKSICLLVSIFWLPVVIAAIVFIAWETHDD